MVEEPEPGRAQWSSDRPDALQRTERQEVTQRKAFLLSLRLSVIQSVAYLCTGSTFRSPALLDGASGSSTLLEKTQRPGPAVLELYAAVYWGPVEGCVRLELVPRLCPGKHQAARPSDTPWFAQRLAKRAERTP